MIDRELRCELPSSKPDKNGCKFDVSANHYGALGLTNKMTPRHFKKELESVELHQSLYIRIRLLLDDALIRKGASRRRFSWFMR